MVNRVPVCPKLRIGSLSPSLSLSSLIGKVAVFGNGPILGGRIYTSTCIYYSIRPCGDHDRRDRSLELMSCTALDVSLSLITGLTR